MTYEECMVEAINYLREQFPLEVKKQVYDMYIEDPKDWYVEHHFFWGMHIRNELRNHGLKDEFLPTGNWDDYYVEAIEKAVLIPEIIKAIKELENG